MADYDDREINPYALALCLSLVLLAAIGLLVWAAERVIS